MSIPLQKLINHVGCGSVDEIAACAYCDAIRQHLRRADAEGRALHPESSATAASPAPEFYSSQLADVAETEPRLNTDLRALVGRWRANADLLAEGNTAEEADPSVGMQRACADQLEAQIGRVSDASAERADATPRKGE